MCRPLRNRIADESSHRRHRLYATNSRDCQGPGLGSAKPDRLVLKQAASRKPVPGALGKPTDLALFLVGHDTNQENIAGVLDLTWIVDGRRDDTPPGGALVFELWRSRASKAYFVRTFFTSQTLEQMRGSIPLSEPHAPDRVPVFIPGCSGADMSCDLHGFLSLVQR